MKSAAGRKDFVPCPRCGDTKPTYRQGCALCYGVLSHQVHEGVPGLVERDLAIAWRLISPEPADIRTFLVEFYKQREED